MGAKIYCNFIRGALKIGFKWPIRNYNSESRTLRCGTFQLFKKKSFDEYNNYHGKVFKGLLPTLLRQLPRESLVYIYSFINE